MRRPSSKLTDVAKLAGVSVATASKALNGRKEVASATRLRVQRAAAQLSFVHNRQARSLSTGRTGIVGLLTSDLEGRFSLPILMGAEDAFGAEQTSILLSDARGDAVREARHLDTFVQQRIDALMVVGSRTDPRRSLGSSYDFPIVYVYTPSESPEDCSLAIDNVDGGYKVAEHLAMIGRRKLLHITGPLGDTAATDRAQGIDAFITASASSLQLSHRTSYGQWSERWGRSAALMTIEKGVEFDAIVCDSDQIARGALGALAMLGIAVPDQVAIASFDNWELLVADTTPPITSVDMKLTQLGQQAAGLLTDAISGTPLPIGVHQMNASLVVRGSTLP